MFLRISHNKQTEKIKIIKILTKKTKNSIDIYYVTEDGEEVIVPGFVSWEVTEH